MHANEQVQYSVHITNATQHLAKVSANFPAAKEDNPLVMLPVWRTGKYQVMPLANGIRDFHAVNDKGESLVVDKVDKSSWRIRLPANNAFTVNYELYANELGSRTRHIDDTHAYLDASATFVYSEASKALPITVALNIPDTWQSRSGMSADASCKHCFMAPNYDVLISSPIETGIHQFFSEKVAGKTIELLIWGHGNHDGKKMMADLTAIAKTTMSMFDSAPFERYLFIVHATDTEGGATEHLNSTVIQKPRWSFAPKKEYLKFLRTSAHEFFHTWNVKAYRPAGLVPYDYQKENYSELLWISEGHTSYFDGLIAYRAGVQTKKEYLEELSDSLERYLDTPGRFQQNALASSFDEWIQPSGDRHRNASVSIYPKGEMIGLAMDLMIRKATKGKKGLEHVHQYLWQHHRVENGGFNSNDVKRALNETAKLDWEMFWRDYVEGTKELPLLSLLNDAGFELSSDKKTEDSEPYYWWGLETANGSEKEFAVVQSVTKDGPAWLAGVVAGDVLVALNHHQLTAKNAKDMMQYAKDTPTQLTIFRRDEMRSLTLQAQKRTAEKQKLVELKKIKRAQQELQKAWLQ